MIVIGNWFRAKSDASLRYAISSTNKNQIGVVKTIQKLFVNSAKSYFSRTSARNNKIKLKWIQFREKFQKHYIKRELSTTPQEIPEIIHRAWICKSGEFSSKTQLNGKPERSCINPSESPLNFGMLENWEATEEELLLEVEHRRPCSGQPTHSRCHSSSHASRSMCIFFSLWGSIAVGKKPHWEATWSHYYLPIEWIQSDGARNFHVILNQHFSHVPFKIGQLNCALVGVGEVNMIVNPVHGQSIRCYNLITHHNSLVASLINWCPVTIENAKEIQWWACSSSWYMRFLLCGKSDCKESLLKP